MISPAAKRIRILARSHKRDATMTRPQFVAMIVSMGYSEHTARRVWQGTAA